MCVFVLSGAPLHVHAAPDPRSVGDDHVLLRRVEGGFMDAEPHSTSCMT